MRQFILCALVTVAAHAAAQAPAKKTPAPSSAEFNSNVESLGPNFRPHDILAVLQVMPKPPTKGEFEKAEEFEARKTRWAEAAFLGQLRPSSVFAFDLNPALEQRSLKSTYDADKEILNVRIDTQYEFLNGSTAEWIETYLSIANKGVRPAVTRMGVKFQVEHVECSHVGIALTNTLSTSTFEVPMAAAEARAAKQRLAILLLVQLDGPFSIRGEARRNTASLDDPVERRRVFFGLWGHVQEAWLYDRPTGRIYQKVSMTPPIK